MIKEIYNFLKTFTNIVSEEDKNKLINIKSHLEFVDSLKYKESKFGNHYDCCVWSNDNAQCGPDTCNCRFYDIDKIKGEAAAAKIIKNYKNIYNTVKNNHCNFNNR